MEIKRPFLDSIEISACEDLNALEKAPPQIMLLRILSGKGAVQIMPFQKLGGKCHFLLRFCTRKRSETYIYIYIIYIYIIYYIITTLCWKVGNISGSTELFAL